MAAPLRAARVPAAWTEHKTATGQVRDLTTRARLDDGRAAVRVSASFDVTTSLIRPLPTALARTRQVLSDARTTVDTLQIEPCNFERHATH